MDGSAAGGWEEPGLRIAMTGTFGFRPKGTLSARALPLAQALAARGHTVEIVTPPWDWPEDSGLVEERGGVTLRNLKVPARLNPASVARITADMLRALRQFRPDVIHCFKPKGFGGLATDFWFRSRGRAFPWAAIVTDADDWEGEGGWNDVMDYPDSMKGLFAWQEQRLLTRSDAVTVASRELYRMARAMRDGESVAYLPNALAALPPEETREVQGPVILLYTRFVEFAPERVVRVLAKVRETVPDARVRVVGASADGQAEELLLAAARGAGVQDGLDVLGWTDPAALPGLFATAACAIVPFDDTLLNRAKSSVKLLELLAHRVPVVADGVGQNAEVIQQGRSGFLVSPGNVDAMAAAAVRLLRDPALGAEVGAAARQRVAESFTWDRLAPVAEQAYGR